MSTTITELGEILQTLLIKDANELGRESGFIQRQRKLTGSSFAQSLIFGWQANPKASLDELCQSARLCDVAISPQGLQERLNSPQSSQFLYELMMKGMDYLVQADGGREDLLKQFNGVYIQDSSKIELPKQLQPVWQGNDKNQSTLKIQTLFNYQQGHLRLSLASGRAHDCPLQCVDLPAGSLRLADVGYFKVSIFEQLNQKGVWWLSRLPARVGIWVGETVQHVFDWIIQQKNDIIDQVVQLTAQCLACRLIAVRVPPDVAQERRKRVRESARSRKKSHLKPETLALCDWTIIVTNMSVDDLSVQDALSLLRVRWQIELLFKLWKSELSVDSWRSQHPYRILSEIYAKLLVALIQHWCFILSCWDNQARSLVKATHVLRKHAFHVLATLHNLPSLVAALQRILPTLNRCSIQKRKSRPATFEILARDSP